MFTLPGRHVSRMHGGVRRDQPIAVVQDLVAHEECELILQTLLLVAQALVDEHGARRLEARAYQSASRLAAVPVEPADLEAVMLAETDHGVEVERHLALAALFRRALDVRKIVVTGFLPYTDEQLRELAPRRAGLRQELGQRILQKLVRKQERRLERHRLETAALAPRRCGFDVGVLVEKPACILAENSREHLEGRRRRRALAGLHHAQIGHRGGLRGIDVHTARRELVERQAVALAQGAQLRPEKMSLPNEAGSWGSPGAKNLSEFHIVKFLLCKSACFAI